MYEANNLPFKFFNIMFIKPHPGLSKGEASKTKVKVLSFGEDIT